MSEKMLLRERTVENVVIKKESSLDYVYGK